MAKLLVIINSILVFLHSVLGFGIMPSGLALDADKLNANVTQSNEKRIAQGTVTGTHTMVYQNGEMLFNQTYGFSGANREPLQDNAVYRIASMTKPITALALLIEHDRGHLSIYDEVSKYIPEFKERYVAKKDKDGNFMLDENGNMIPGEKAKNTVKLYQLVSHVSGVGEVVINNAGGKSCTLDSAVEYLIHQPLTFDPGTEQCYSTGAFDIAAKIIEMTSGMEFEQYLKVNIFDKLGMTDTTFEPTKEQYARMVKVHNLENGEITDAPTEEGCVFGNFPVTYHAAGAGLASTTSDYMKFAKMLLNGGKADDGTVILSENTLKLMSTPVSDETRNSNTLWGLGVRVIVKPGAGIPVGCFGWSGAYGSHFWIDPTNKLCVVYMKNSAYDGGAGNKSATELENDVYESFSLKQLG